MVYAAVMMYASGEWVFALLDLVVVSPRSVSMSS